MLTKVEARTAQGNVLGFTLLEPSNGTILAEVEGLDPVKANLVTTKLAGVDGSRYRTGVREERNIVLKFELFSDTVDNLVPDVRRRLYQYFMPKSQVTLWFYESSGTVTTITGRVESCAAPLFTQEPAMDVAILCFDPDLVETTQVTLLGNTVYSTLEDEVEYEGDVPTGVELTLNVNRDLGSFTFYNRLPDGTLRQLDFAKPLLAGDVVYINTNRGNKKVLLTRAGVVSSILYAASPSSNWITFDRGLNRYRIYAEGAGIPFTIKYANRYGGL